MTDSKANPPVQPEPAKPAPVAPVVEKKEHEGPGFFDNLNTTRDTLLTYSRWANVADLIYFFLFALALVLVSYIAEVNCTEAGLLTYGKAAFWLILGATFFAAASTVTIWNINSFKNANPYEFWAYFTFGLIELVLAVIAIIWAWPVVAANKNIAGCADLYDIAWAFSIITLIYLVGRIVLDIVLYFLYKPKDGEVQGKDVEQGTKAETKSLLEKENK